MLVSSISKLTSKLPELQFANQPTALAPNWAEWASEFGYQLQQHAADLQSNLIVTTTPCQSPLSAILSFGFLLGELENTIGTRNAESYFEYLCSLPEGTRVKMRDTKRLRPKVYTLCEDRSPERGIAMKQIEGRGANKCKNSRMFILKEHSLKYVVDQDEDSTTTGVDALSEYAASALIDRISENLPVDQNWRASLDSIVVSGPTGGHSSPRRQFESTFFTLNDEMRFSLAEVLAVKEWKSTQDQTPHYSHFFNSSARRQTESPEIVTDSKIVIFTSVDSFLRFTEKFQQQTQVVVVSRDIDESRMERFDAALRRHRERAEPLALSEVALFPQPPEGIQLFFCGAKKQKQKQWR